MKSAIFTILVTALILAAAFSSKLQATIGGSDLGMLTPVSMIDAAPLATGTLQAYTGINKTQYDGVALVVVKSGSAGTITFALQDSADDVTYTNVANSICLNTGTATISGTTTVNSVFKVNLNACEKYIRLTGTRTSGTASVSATLIAAPQIR